MRLGLRRALTVLTLVLAVALASAVAQALPLVTFEWDPATESVAPGTTQVSVDLLARQTGDEPGTDDDADAAAFTLGFTFSGAVTGVALDSFGAQVSALDSYFGDVGGGEIAMIAVAPSTPGSFGIGVDVLPVATLLVSIDTSAGFPGVLGLKDLSALAGPPVLEMDGFTEIPANLGAQFVVTPEPAAGLLVGLGLAGLGLFGSRRSTARKV